MPSIDLPLLDWLEILDRKLRSGNYFIAVDHGQQATVLISNGGSDSSVLDVWMSAELFFRAEDAISVCYVILDDFVSPEVGAIEAEPFQLFPEPVIKEGLAELHVAVHDALLQQLLKLMMMDV